MAEQQRQDIAAWQARFREKARKEIIEKYRHRHTDADDQEIKEFKDSEEFKDQFSKKLQNKTYLSSFDDTPSKEILKDIEKYHKNKTAKAKRAARDRIWNSAYEKYDFEKLFYEYTIEILPKFEKRAKQYLTRNIVYVNSKSINSFARHPLDRTNLLEFLGKDRNTRHPVLIPKFLNAESEISEYIYNKLKRFEEFSDFNDPALKARIKKLVYDLKCNELLLNELEERFQEEVVIELIRKNPRYESIIDDAVAEMHRQEDLKNAILKEIPSNPAELFPFTRRMQRSFVLHIGPTNSGKTYEAIEALKKAETGIYLAPLRLMAFEIFSKLNLENVPCVMETGEELLEVPNAKHYAKTIELLDDAEYDVAVIDEAQMVGDISRGGAWTNAILGVRAKEIHICCSANAEDILIKLINLCGDEYRVVRHKRKTPLKMESKPFIFPKSVEPGDALIVFSKRAVIACAADLQAKGYKCSVIYGSLPYDVREKEVQKFLSGKTDIVVATDAIGMGLNLPVKRIVFLQTEKFDGTERRPLTSPEVKQIAGRAGRYGIEESGYCTSERNVNEIREKLEMIDAPITKAVMSFPKSIIELDGSLVEIISQWDKLALISDYQKQSVDEMLVLAKELEYYSNDKANILTLITIPFDVHNDILFNIWKQHSIRVLQREKFSLEIDIEEERIQNAKESVDELEFLYKKYDLYYHFAKRDKNQELMRKLTADKRQISDCIVAQLKTKKFQRNRCSICGKPIPWNHGYSICDRCYKKQFLRSWYF